MQKAQLRGHLIYFIEAKQAWFYTDNNRPIDSEERACVRCNKKPTPEGHDACLGHMKGVKHACCGHGFADPYFVLDNGEMITSLSDAREHGIMRELEEEEKK